MPVVGLHAPPPIAAQARTGAQGPAAGQRGQMFSCGLKFSGTLATAWSGDGKEGVCVFLKQKVCSTVGLGPALGASYRGQAGWSCWGPKPGSPWEQSEWQTHDHSSLGKGGGPRNPSGLVAEPRRGKPAGTAPHAVSLHPPLAQTSGL